MKVVPKPHPSRRRGPAGKRRALNLGRYVFRDLVSGKIPPSALMLRRDPVYGGHAIGMNAIVHGNGFRIDGSWQYGDLLARPPAQSQLRATTITASVSRPRARRARARRTPSPGSSRNRRS